MKNKDRKLTCEDCATLLNQAFDEQLKTPSGTESCEPAKPTYDELLRKIQSLSGKVYELEQENNALRYSLTKMYVKLEDAGTVAEIWEEEYYREHNRAEHLYDELNKNNKGESK